jgi:hypothetical protein
VVRKKQQESKQWVPDIVEDIDLIKGHITEQREDFDNHVETVAFETKGSIYNLVNTI